MQENTNWNQRNGEGCNALHLAAEYGHEAVVKQLLDSEKVDVDSKDRDGRTPLLWAAQKGHGAVVKLLLDSEKGERGFEG